MTKKSNSFKTVLLALLLIGITVAPTSMHTPVSTYGIRATEKNVVIQYN